MERMEREGGNNRGVEGREWVFLRREVLEK